MQSLFSPFRINTTIDLTRKEFSLLEYLMRNSGQIYTKKSVFGTENSDGSITAQNLQLGALPGPMNSPSATPKK